MKHIGVAGLGNMGRGMALSLQRGGFTVSGYDPASAAVESIAREGVNTFASVAALAAEVDVLILSLPTSDVVEAVVFGADGVLASAKAGLLVVDTTTADPNSTRKVAAALAEKGVRFIDAPVSGGPKGAITGTMTMVLGGAAEDVAAVTPVLEAMSAKRVHVGPVGAGHVTKLLNNLMCGAHLIAAAKRRASLPQPASTRNKSLKESTRARAAAASRKSTIPPGFSTTPSTPDSR